MNQNNRKHNSEINFQKKKEMFLDFCTPLHLYSGRGRSSPGSWLTPSAKLRRIFVLLTRRLFIPSPPPIWIGNRKFDLPINSPYGESKLVRANRIRRLPKDSSPRTFLRLPTVITKSDLNGIWSYSSGTSFSMRHLWMRSLQTRWRSNGRTGWGGGVTLD